MTALSGSELIGSNLRGSNPPFKVCPGCGSVSSEPWDNPILVVMRRLGFYKGETTGGSCVCERCDEGFKCLDCMDTGFRKSNDDHERLERCDCSVRARTVRGLPIEYLEANMDNFVDNEDRRIAKESGYRFLRNEVDGLYIRGSVGVGKTRLMASILNTLVTRSSCAFVRVPELLDRMRQAGFGPSSSGSDEAEYLSIYQRVEFLGLDDVGADKGSDYGRRTLLSLYESRMDEGKRTIWTSNLSLAQLEEFFGDERLSSRIAGNSDVVNIEGQDMRLS